MVGTIVPVGYGRSRRKWLLAAIIYTIGTGVSSFILGVVLAALGQFVLRIDVELTTPALFVLAIIALLYGIHEFGIVHMPYPQLKRQVPLRWRYELPHYITPLAYGIGLGVGYGTFIAVGTLHVVALGAFLAGTPLLGGIIFASFGLGRALPLLILGPKITSPSQIAPTVNFLMGKSWLVHIVNGILLSTTAGWFIAGLITSIPNAPLF